MKPLAVVVVLALIMSVGVYIGMTGFQQYALESSRSRAGQAVCAPERPVIAPGRAVTFSISGLPENTTPHWSSPAGRTEQTADSRASVVFTERGEQTVFAFFLVGNLWQRASCSVTVR